MLILSCDYIAIAVDCECYVDVTVDVEFAGVGWRSKMMTFVKRSMIDQRRRVMSG